MMRPGLQFKVGDVCCGGCTSQEGVMEAEMAVALGRGE